MEREFEALAAEIFAEALEVDPEDRPDLIAARCGADAVLRSRVEALLTAHAKGGLLLRSTRIREQLREASAAWSDRNLGRQIGAYQITRLLAAGGMGSVYLGERRDVDFDQRVAIKLLHTGVCDEGMLARFRSERRLLARLEHPNIARLIDGGSTEDGVPYLVMEYIDGVPLDRYCDGAKLTLAGRLELFCSVCEAVQFAHANLIVHRDIKPGNLLVGAERRVKLLDFGIGKLIDPEYSTDVTATEYRAMTPRYASPEQLRGEPLTVATDIYSLGVVLYELMTGRLPHEVAGTTAEFVRAVSEDDPLAPSVAVIRSGSGAAAQAAAAFRGSSARRLAQGLAGDLDTIVLKALRREPPRRYASAAEFAADIRRHLAGLPVTARPDTVRYRLSKFARRNRALVSGVMAAFLALGAGLATSLKLYEVAVRHREEAEFLAYGSSIAATESLIRTNRMADARRQLEAAPERFRGWEWNHLSARLDRSLLEVAAHAGAVTGVQFIAGGTRIVSVSEDLRLRVWNAATGAALADFGPLDAPPRSLAVDAAGSIAAVGLEDGRVRVFDLSDGRLVMKVTEDYDFAYEHWRLPEVDDSRMALLDRASTWSTVDIHPDGRHLAVGTFLGRVGVYDLETQTEVAAWEHAPHGYRRLVRFHPSGTLLAVAAELGPVSLWDARERHLVREFEDAPGVVDMCFDPEGSRLAACYQDQSIRVWDVASGQLLARILGNSGSIRDIEFDAAGEAIVATATDGQLAAWELATGRRRWVYPGPLVSSQCLSRSPDGSRLVSGDWDGVVRVWRFDTQDVRTLAVPGAGFRRHWAQDAWLSEDGERLVTTTIGTVGHVWNLTEGGDPVAVVLGERDTHGRTISVTGIDGSGEFLAGMTGGFISIGSLDSLRTRQVLAHDGEIVAVDRHPDGESFVTASRDSTLKLWDPALDKPMRILSGHECAVLTARYSPDGRRIASGGADGRIRLWDAGTGSPLTELGAHHGAVRRLAYSPDGAWLASASDDGTVRLWDANAGELLATVLDIGRRIDAVCFSHDGSRLAAAGYDGVVYLIDPAARRVVARLYGHGDRIFWLGFTVGDSTLISTSLDGTIRIWDGGSARPPVP